jgi:ATP-binding cassette, subfamily B (MDR/TAP), member 1
MMIEADKQDKIKDDKTKESLTEVKDPKKQGALFRKKINQYNKPIIASIMGVLFSAAAGLANPVFGAIMIKCIFSMLLLPPDQYYNASDVMNEWVRWLGWLALAMFVAATLKGISFGYVGETITMNIRRDVYVNVIRKHMGWHDIRTNNSGVITSVMAGECSQLQGLSTDAFGVILECIASLGFAIAIGFYFSWPMALIALCLTPFMAIGALLQGVQRDETKDEAELLAADAIANFKTVSSFGCDDQILAKYKDLSEKPFAQESGKLQKFAISYGFSQLIQNVVFGALYYASA